MPELAHCKSGEQATHHDFVDVRSLGHPPGSSSPLSECRSRARVGVGGDRCPRGRQSPRGHRAFRGTPSAICIPRSALRRRFKNRCCIWQYESPLAVDRNFCEASRPGSQEVHLALFFQSSVSGPPCRGNRPPVLARCACGYGQRIPSRAGLRAEEGLRAGMTIYPSPPRPGPP